MYAVLLLPGGPPVPLAMLPRLSVELYESQAGIVSVPLTPQQLAVAAETRLVIVDQFGSLLLAENEQATFVRATGSCSG